MAKSAFILMSDKLRISITLLETVTAVAAIVFLPTGFQTIVILVLLGGLAFVWLPTMKSVTRRITLGVGIILIGLLVFYGGGLWHQFNTPHPKIVRISYKINEDPIVEAANGDILTVKTGDKISLLALTYSTPMQGGLVQRVQGEAYIRKGGRDDEDIDYKDGRFTKEVLIEQGVHEIGDFIIGPTREKSPYWTVKSGWNRIMVILVHYYRFGHSVDDMFYLNIAIE
jgi:hypothetical protein